MAGNEAVKVLCPECGGGFRNHKVLREHDERWQTDDDSGATKFQIVQCQGCESIRFRMDSWSTHDINMHTGDPESFVRVFPEHMANAREPVIELHADLPSGVERIYRETVGALNAGTLILAGAGLRAIVEAICLDASAPGKNLAEKIDGLVTLKLLAEPQAELLHEERYIGNKAVHEVEPPSRKQVEDGLAIVETMLNTMYVARASARRLREDREKAAAAKAAKKALAATATASAKAVSASGGIAPVKSKSSSK